MKKPAVPTQADPAQFAKHVESLRLQFQSVASQTPLNILAAQTGSVLSVNSATGSEFCLSFWGQEIVISLPDMQIKESKTGTILSPPNQALLLYYFLTADGTTGPTRWISFAELPDGRFYNQAYQGYTGAQLARHFENDIEHFAAAAAIIGGVLQAPDPLTPGDLSFHFRALPRLSLLIAYWQGDEDFPASAQILFENLTPHYLPTDVCAYLGSSLARRLLKQ